MDKIRIICGTCGSDDVRADAYAEWSVETQKWECSATFDKGAVCEHCGGETRLEEIPADQAPMSEDCDCEECSGTHYEV